MRTVQLPPTRQWLLAYDIADPKRLRCAAKWCEQHALRQQRSVFEAVLGHAEQVAMARSLNAKTEPRADALLWVGQCQRCRAGNQRLGLAVDSTVGYWVV